MKTKNPFTPKIDLVVTRHAQLVEWLLREGHITEDTPVVAHAHADRAPTELREIGVDGEHEILSGSKVVGHAFSLAEAIAIEDQHNAANVRGKNVIGVLPHHLSAEAKSITEVQLDWTLEDREAMTRGDLDVEAVARAARGLHTYRVTKYGPEIRPEVAFARAIDEADFCGDGVGIRFLSNDHAALVEVKDVHGYKAVQVDLYKGAMRSMSSGKDGWVAGPWLDPLTDRPLRLVGAYDTAVTEAKIAAGAKG